MKSVRIMSRHLSIFSRHECVLGRHISMYMYRRFHVNIPLVVLVVIGEGGGGGIIIARGP